MDSALKFQTTLLAWILALVYICAPVSFYQGMQGIVATPAPISGGPTFSIVQSEVQDSNSGLTTSATAAGNANIVCVGYTNATIIAATVTDDASGGSNTYTLRATSEGLDGPNTLASQCYDSINTGHAGATHIIVTGLSGPAYVVVEFYEAHRTSGSWTFDLANKVNTGVGTGTNVPGPALAMTGAPGFAVTSYLVNNTIGTNPASGSIWTAGAVTSPDGNGANSIITVSSGTQTSAVTDTASGDNYVSSGVAYK